MKEPYVGTVDLLGGEIAEDIAGYFVESEQIPTACALGVLVDRDQSVKSAGGYLIQLMPGAGEDTIARVEGRRHGRGGTSPPCSSATPTPNTCCAPSSPISR